MEWQPTLLTLRKECGTPPSPPPPAPHAAPLHPSSLSHIHRLRRVSGAMAREGSWSRGGLPMGTSVAVIFGRCLSVSVFSLQHACTYSHTDLHAAINHPRPLAPGWRDSSHVQVRQEAQKCLRPLHPLGGAQHMAPGHVSIAIKQTRQ